MTRRLSPEPVTQLAHRHAVWLLLAAVALAYLPAWNGGLVWDDAAHLTAPALQSLHGLWRIWTEPGATQQYYPLAHSVFWLESHLWGTHVTGYHLVNIALHATSAVLLLLILQRLAVPGAWLAAFLFALHPVHVESVAWISELKNTLSTALYLAGALAYLRFDETRKRAHYAIALLLFLLALLSKTVTATLPVALLIVFWWKRGRLDLRRDVLPLLPFLAAGIAAGLMTAWMERHFIGAQGTEFQLNLLERMLLAARASWFYLGKLIWPHPLIFIYPRWNIDSGAAWQYAFPIALLALIAAGWLWRRRSRAPLAVLLLFLAGLFPALGFVDVFPFRYSFVADHFQYLASIPVIALAAALLSRWKPWIAAVPLLLAVLTWRQSAQYASAETLYSATIAKNPGAWIAHNNLGRVLVAEGRSAEARAHFIEALRLNPNVAEHHANIGLVLLGEGDVGGAVPHLREAIRLEPRNPNAYSNLGVALLRQGQREAAIEQFEHALHIWPEHPQARDNLADVHQAMGIELAQAGRVAEATPHFEAAARYKPYDAMIRYNLGTAYLVLGRRQDAIVELEEALRLRPNFPEAQANLSQLRN